MTDAVASVAAPVERFTASTSSECVPDESEPAENEAELSNSFPGCCWTGVAVGRVLHDRVLGDPPALETVSSDSEAQSDVCAIRGG